jgi:hypothetical protein
MVRKGSSVRVRQRALRKAVDHNPAAFFQHIPPLLFWQVTEAEIAG